MAALTTAEQHLIAKRSFDIQQEDYQKEMKYQCKQCDFETTSRGNLTYHQKSIHLGIKYSCQQCDYQATTKSALTSHHQ